MTKALTSLLVHDLPAWRVREEGRPSADGGPASPVARPASPAGHTVRMTQERVEESVVVEATVELKVNGRTLLRFRCLPDRLDDLAVGFLACEGLIESPAQVKSLHVEPDCIRAEVDVAFDHLVHFFETVALVSGCGRGGSAEVEGVVAIASQEQFSPETCLTLVRALEGSSAVFRATGGVHTAALACGEGLLDVAEDIGRHNAVDKVVGRSLRCREDGPGLAELMLLTTGRISGDIAAKAYRVGLPMVVSPSAPTTAAVELAHRAGICLVGFARGHRLNVYSAAWRLGLAPPCGAATKDGMAL